MRIPEYDPVKARWDEHRRFHNKPKDWVTIFETGEMVLYYKTLHPNQRQAKGTNVYPGSSLCITATNDSDCPRFRLDPEALTAEVRKVFAKVNIDPEKYLSQAIPKAWLNDGGQQEVLLDTDTGRTVGFGLRHRSGAWVNVPAWVSASMGRYRISTYVAGPGAKAVGSKIKISMPPSFTSEEVEAMRQLKEQASAWVTICNGDYLNNAPKFHSYDPKTGTYPYQKPMDLSTLPKGFATELTDLIGEQIFQIYHKGFSTSRVIAYVDSLTAEV